MGTVARILLLIAYSIFMAASFADHSPPLFLRCLLTSTRFTPDTALSEKHRLDPINQKLGILRARKLHRVHEPNIRSLQEEAQRISWQTRHNDAMTVVLGMLLVLIHLTFQWSSFSITGTPSPIEVVNSTAVINDTNVDSNGSSLPAVFAPLSGIQTSVSQTYSIVTVGLIACTPCVYIFLLREVDILGLPEAFILDLLRLIIELPFLIYIAGHIGTISFLRHSFFPGLDTRFTILPMETFFFNLRYIRFWLIMIGLPIGAWWRRPKGTKESVFQFLGGILMLVLFLGVPIVEVVACSAFIFGGDKISTVGCPRLLWNFLTITRHNENTGTSRKVHEDSKFRRFQYLYNMHVLIYEQQGRSRLNRRVLQPDPTSAEMNQTGEGAEHEVADGAQVKHNVVRSVPEVLLKNRSEALSRSIPPWSTLVGEGLVMVRDGVILQMLLLSSGFNCVVTVCCVAVRLTAVVRGEEDFSPQVMLAVFYLLLLVRQAARAAPVAVLYYAFELVTMNTAGYVPTPSRSLDEPSNVYAKRSNNRRIGNPWMMSTIYKQDGDIAQPVADPLKNEWRIKGMDAAASRLLINTCRLIENYFIAPNGDVLVSILHNERTSDTSCLPLLPADVLRRLGDFLPEPYAKLGMTQ